jgi:hypothetical protein
MVNVVCSFASTGWIKSMAKHTHGLNYIINRTTTQKKTLLNEQQRGNNKKKSNEMLEKIIFIT